MSVVIVWKYQQERVFKAVIALNGAPDNNEGVWCIACDVE